MNAGLQTQACLPVCLLYVALCSYTDVHAVLECFAGFEFLKYKDNQRNYRNTV